jgi:SAM-dependent methyltransferase
MWLPKAQIQMLSAEAKQSLIDTYRRLFLKHKEGPQVAKYKTKRGQFMRLEQLITIADLSNCTVLEIGCGLGDFCGLLQERFQNVEYYGVDIVPELVAEAARRYPEAKFECRDLLAEPLEQQFDYVFISGVFNTAIPGANDFLKSLTAAGFAACKVALGFNFISTYVNYTEPDASYHDPVDVFSYCVNSLSRKTTILHHYERTDVCVFVYR